MQLGLWDLYWVERAEINCDISTGVGTTARQRATAKSRA